MRFICCDLENTSWEDDVDPRHFITVRQAPPAVDPKQAPQSLLSLTVHTHRHTHARAFIFTTQSRRRVCESAHGLSHSLFTTFILLRPLHYTQAHETRYGFRRKADCLVIRSSTTCHHFGGQRAFFWNVFWAFHSSEHAECHTIASTSG